jgi:hypothetical protein
MRASWQEKRLRLRSAQACIILACALLLVCLVQIVEGVQAIDDDTTEKIRIRGTVRDKAGAAVEGAELNSQYLERRGVVVR